jgi:hypothetical protein
VNLPRPAVGAAVVLGAAAAPLVAQEASFFLGGIHATYADTISGSAGTAGLRLRFQSAAFWTQADAYFSQFTSGGWSAQGNLGILTMHPVGRHLALGLRADGNANAFEGGSWSGIGSLGPYLAVSGGGWIGVAGAVAGGVRDIEGTTRPLVTPTLRVSRLAGRFVFDARASASWADSLRFGDGLLAATFTARSVTISATGGMRIGDLGDEPWAQGSVAWRLSAHVQLETAIGTYPADLTGFTEGFFVNAGIRIGTRRTPAIPRPTVRVNRVGEQEVQVTFTVPDAIEVAIAGEWNAWTPTPLSKIDGTHWRATLPLGPGAYHFSLVVDGDRWIVPEGVPNMPDDFGGEVGLLLVGGQDD